jgi:Flp pilus assembly protein TadG
MRFTRSRRELGSRRRRGTAAVETAVVFPIYLMLLFGVIEFGHAQLVLNLLNSAVRNGARLGSTEGTTTANVTSRVNQTVGTVVAASKISVYVKDASSFDSSTAPAVTDAAIEALPNCEVSSADPRQLFLVRAKVRYNDICLVPMPFLKNITLDAQAFMRHE